MQRPNVCQQPVLRESVIKNEATMARPKKKTLDYFEVDVGIAQKLKVRKLINRKGGARALGVFVYLLCRIYRNGYYMDCSPDAIFEIAADLCEQEDYGMEVVLYCCISAFAVKKVAMSENIRIFAF